MTNTEKYYTTLRGWRKTMREIESEYQKALKKLEPHRGSVWYENSKAELDKARSDDLEAVKMEYHNRFKAIIDDMKKAFDSKPMKAPSTEQLNLLQALKLRSTISRSELHQAANTMKDCPAALEALREISKNLGVPAGITQGISGNTVASNDKVQ